MSNVLAIETPTEPYSIVMVADDQVGGEVWEDGTFVKVHMASKIVTGKTWMMGIAGGHDKSVIRFFERLGCSNGEGVVYGNNPSRGELMIKNAEERYASSSSAPNFPAVSELCEEMLETGWDKDDLPSFILATRSKDSTGLYLVDSEGNFSQKPEIEDLMFYNIGCYEEGVRDFMYRRTIRDDFNFVHGGVKDCVDFAREAIEHASFDSETGNGIELAILSVDGVDVYTKEIQETIRKAKDSVFKIICSRYF